MSPLPKCENSVLLHEMMARLGIDLGPDDLARLELRYPTAFRRCHACAARALASNGSTMPPRRASRRDFA